MKKYETKKLETERLILKKGDSSASKKVYEYDLTKCTGIDGQNELIKFDEPIDFIGPDVDEYYNDCEVEKMYDWYLYLKESNIPVGNVLADREDENGSIELSYNIHPKFWGNGYAVEAIETIIDYLKQLDYKKIVIHFYAGNDKSKRVCEKLNFKFNKVEEKFYAPTNKQINEYEYILEL